MRRTLALSVACLTVVALANCADDPFNGEAPGSGQRRDQPSNPEALESSLRKARDLSAAPPSFYGTHEYRSERETVFHEVWVDWPAFRLSLTGELNDPPEPPDERPPLIIATLDGKRFGVSDPGSDSTYMTRSLGEAPWVLGPILNLFADVTPCVSEDVLGEDRILGRAAIRVRCLESPDVEGWFDTWVDEQTGLVLRQVFLDLESEPSWSGFTHLEFDPEIDPSLLDPTVLVDAASA